MSENDLSFKEIKECFEELFKLAENRPKPQRTVDIIVFLGMDDDLLKQCWNKKAKITMTCSLGQLERLNKRLETLGLETI